MYSLKGLIKTPYPYNLEILLRLLIVRCFPTIEVLKQLKQRILIILVVTDV